VEISVVIPTLDEARGIARAIESVSEAGVEVLVVDGGSRDETVRLAREAGARVLAGERGRARQLRLGGERACGEAIVFLHADTTLSSGWSEGIRRVLSDPECAGGAFEFRLATRGPWQEWIEFWVKVRVRLLGLPYGDQAIFLRREVLEAMGGVPIVPLLEDLDLVRGIQRAGRLAMIDLPATTSARRYRTSGRLRTIVHHVVALLGFYMGCDRARLARWMGR
jgi:rSAM/selenodomain-associated transferase 2